MLLVVVICIFFCFFVQDAQEKKRQEQLERKKENERLYQEEVESMKSAKAEVKPKLTRAEIAAHQETMAAEGLQPEKHTVPLILHEE